LSPTENAALPITPTLRGPAAGVAGSEDTGHPRKWFILAAVSLGMFMSLLDVTIVNIAVPKIMESLHATVTSVSWVLNAYSLTLGVLFLSMGRLADKFGQKRIFVMGLGTFTAFSLLCGLAPSIGWLIALRVGQAVGGAAMAPISLAILLTAFPAHQRGAAIGIWAALGSVAAAVGPTLGGILVTYGAWHWIFFVNIPIGIFALVFAIIVVPERRRAGSEESVDAVGVAMSSVGLFCLTLALLKGNDWGWSSATIIGLLVVAVLSYPAFVWWESRTRWPMFDFRLLRIRSFAAANTTMMFIGATLGGSMLLLVLFMVTVLGYTELKAAVVMTAAPVVAIIVGPFVGRYVDKIGPRFLAAVGAALFSISMLLFATLGVVATPFDLIWRGAILGLGLGLTMPTMSAAAMGSVPDRSRGVASGALNMMRQIGFTLGIAVLVSLLSHSMTVNTKAATTQVVAYVQQQRQLPAQAQQQIVAALQKGAAAGNTGGAKDALANAPQYPAGSPQAKAQEKLVAAIGSIYKNRIAKSFPLPFYFAALAAALAIIPALMTGRRLGEHLGHEDLTRAQRAAAEGGEA
jgi:EmrB/QacA subfamily drug resistance transporter